MFTGDRVAVALDRILVIDEIAVGVQVGTTLNVDLESIPQADEGLADGRVSTRLLDLHRVPHPKLALLDLRRLLTRSVAQHERVAHANRFAVNFERAPAGLVLDPV